MWSIPFNLHHPLLHLTIGSATLMLPPSLLLCCRIFYNLLQDSRKPLRCKTCASRPKKIDLPSCRDPTGKEWHKSPPSQCSPSASGLIDLLPTTARETCDVDPLPAPFEATHLNILQHIHCVRKVPQAALYPNKPELFLKNLSEGSTLPLTAEELIVTISPFNILTSTRRQWQIKYEMK